ncbi:hypothetical protein V8G54_027425 [Vigna mungo]|uniref:Uncharacterized protein n=1 Tax=Vigna mungo TaxID=3915 RepID=A0AAQ3N2T9_VIGMU
MFKYIFFSLLTQKSPPPNPPPAPPPAPPHGASMTILATPSTTPLFQKSITRDQKLGLPISIHTLSARIALSSTCSIVGPTTSITSSESPESSSTASGASLFASRRTSDM